MEKSLKIKALFGGLFNYTYNLDFLDLVILLIFE
jgi:hypothetical protein